MVQLHSRWQSSKRKTNRRSLLNCRRLKYTLQVLFPYSFLLIIFCTLYSSASITPKILNTPPTIAQSRVKRCNSGVRTRFTSIRNGEISYTKKIPGITAGYKYTCELFTIFRRRRAKRVTFSIGRGSMDLGGPIARNFSVKVY